MVSPSNNITALLSLLLLHAHARAGKPAFPALGTYPKTVQIDGVTEVQDKPLPCPDGETHCSRPTLRLKGQAFVTLPLNADAEYVDPGAGCTDVDGSDIGHAVQVEGNVGDTKVPGRSYLTYRCTDVHGNSAIPLLRVVTVRRSRPAQIVAGGQHSVVRFELVLRDLRFTDLHFRSARDSGRNDGAELLGAVRVALGAVLDVPERSIKMRVEPSAVNAIVAGSRVWTARVLIDCGTLRGTATRVARHAAARSFKDELEGALIARGHATAGARSTAQTHISLMFPTKGAVSTYRVPA